MPQSTDLNFNFKSSQSKLAAYISGGWGAKDAQGNVVAHLYLEYPALPSVARLQISPEGRVLNGSTDEVAGEYTREVVATLIMTPDVATSLGELLIEAGKQDEQKEEDDERPR